jgi:LytS/YehU family sensor histidine kinase
MSAGKGIGLSNTRNRLKHLYGSQGVLHAANRSPHGMIVTVQLPFHTEPLEPAHAIESSRR